MSYGRMFKKDTATDALVSTDYAHHAIHEGNHFHATYVEDIASGASLEILFCIQSGSTRVHMFFDTNVEAESTFSIIEDITSATTRGIGLTAYNNDRNSSNTSDIVLRRGPGGLVVTSAETIYFSRISAGKFWGEQGRELNELILKSGTTYLLRVTNNSAGNGWTGCHGGWYELGPTV